jgi:hypothetical protein
VYNEYWRDYLIINAATTQLIILSQLSDLLVLMFPLSIWLIENRLTGHNYKATAIKHF